MRTHQVQLAGWLLSSVIMSDAIPPLDELDRIYSAVLDQLLFPPHVKEQLLASQPPEKKWQQCLLHKTTTENKEDMKALSWGDKDRKLLSDIRKVLFVYLFIYLFGY